jgi:hypothetical protein
MRTDTLTIRIRTLQRADICASCPPDRICAWSCLQGIGISDAVVGAALLLDGRLNPQPDEPEPAEEAAQDALWDSFNVAG